MTWQPHFRDTIGTGLLAGLGTSCALAILLTFGLMLAGLHPLEHLRWYAAAFIPPILLLRTLVKRQYLLATKTLMVTLFVTLVSFIAILLRTNTLQLQ